jgi:hypothetical protein
MGRFGSLNLFSPHHSWHVFKYYLSDLIWHRKCVTTIQDWQVQYRMTHYIIRLAKWRLSDLGERLIFANKLFTRVSFCSSSGSSSIVIGCLIFFVPLQSESPEHTVLIFAVFPRPSKSFNICQQTGRDAFDVERMSTTTENVPSGFFIVWQ